MFITQQDHTQTKLSDRVAALEKPDNRVDVLVEVALFQPNNRYLGCRANKAGTKAIYTDRNGDDHTHWACDWTHESLRLATVASLKARGL